MAPNTYVTHRSLVKFLYVLHVFGFKCIFCSCGWSNRHNHYTDVIEPKFRKLLIYVGRTYPVPFAKKIVNIRKNLIDGRPMEPMIPSPSPTGPEILMSTPEDEEGLFASADLGSVYKYLRGGKGLALPDHWREYMPHVAP